MDYASTHPNFADTPYLRDRMRSALPPIRSRPTDDSSISSVQRV